MHEVLFLYGLFHLLKYEFFILLRESFVHFIHVEVLQNLSKSPVVWLCVVLHVLNMHAKVAQVDALLGVAHAIQAKTLFVSFDELHSFVVVFFYVGRYAQHWQVVVAEHVQDHVADAVEVVSTAG